MKNYGYGMSKKKLLIIVLANEKSFLWLIIYYQTQNISDRPITLFYGGFFFVLSIIGNSIISSNKVIKMFGLDQK